MPETGSTRVERLARSLGFPPGPFMVEVFRDPAPDSIVNQRYALTFVNVLAQLDLSGTDKELLFDTLNLVCIKLSGVWRHLQRYNEHEARLIEAEQARVLDAETPPELSFSQELFWEFDGFAVQVKSVLDYLVKIPVPIVGAGNWRLHTFGERGEKVLRAADRQLKREHRKVALPLMRHLLDSHKHWLDDTIAARDKTIHFQDGGVPYEHFLVLKIRAGEGERIVVPRWTPDITLRDAMRRIWERLLVFTEDFTAGFMAIRLPKQLALRRVALADGVAGNTWEVVTSEQMARDVAQGGIRQVPEE